MDARGVQDFSVWVWLLEMDPHELHHLGQSRFVGLSRVVQQLCAQRGLSSADVPRQGGDPNRGELLGVRRGSEVLLLGAEGRGY